MTIKLNNHHYIRTVRKYRYYLLSMLELIIHFSPLNRIIRIFTGPKKDLTSIITLRKWGLSFEVRSAMDVWSVKETFIDQFYTRYGCPVVNGWMVMDIGGGIGDFSIFASHGFPDNKVYTFEPYPGSFNLLVGNLRRNWITNVQAFQEAIWSSDGRLVLDTSTGEPVQFISRELGRDGANENVSVPCISFKVAMDRLGIEHCDLLKIDAEGAEYAILFEAPDAALLKIDRIVMEYHDAISSHTHADLINFLQAKGFHVKAVENAVHPELGYLFAERRAL